MKLFRWNAEKNELLAKQRGITFDEIVERMEQGAPVTEHDHPNKGKYPNQKVLTVIVNEYAYLVPCVISGDDYFLKTIIPSRKATRKHKGGRK